MKDGVIIYLSHFKSVEGLSDVELGALFRAVFTFASGKNPVIPPHLQIAFNFITSQIERDSEKYNRIVEKRRESGRLGRQAKCKSEREADEEPKPEKSREEKKNDEEPKPKKSREELDKEIEARRLKFERALVPFMEGYGGVYPKEMLRAFADYWTELNKSRTKMRWELQKTWELKLRLATWANREKGKPQAASSQPKNGKMTAEEALRKFTEKFATQETEEINDFKIVENE